MASNIASKRQHRALTSAAILATEEPRDLARAAKIYRREMVRGSGEAAFNLATMYALGEGVKRSWPTTVKLLKRAERLGSSDASVLLAELTFKGVALLKRSTEAAVTHCALAMLRGDPRGLRELTYILEKQFARRPGKLVAALKRATQSIFTKRFAR